MFQSIDSCISPSWYRNKTNIHKFVLERRFSTVHVCDPLRSIETRNGRRLTDQEEEKRPEEEEFEDKSKVSDASEPYVDMMLNSIAWLEIEINQIQSRWKLDQNQGLSDIKGEIIKRSKIN